MYASLFENHCRAVVHLIAFTAMLFRSAGELVVAPLNTESKVGESTYLNCSTNLTSREIFWHHGRNYIYVGDTTGILVPYRERFRIERNASDGSHNLVIHSVEPSDAGEYICIDDDGLGERRSAQLIVLDKDPDCQSNMQPDGVIGQNIFGIPHDEVQLVCSISYHGNTPPRMEWKKVGYKNSTQDSVTSDTSSNNRIIYTLNLKVEISLDKSSYVCQTTRSTQHHYKCTSEIIKVLYFLDRNTTEENVVRGDEITCATKNNTFSCINQWYIGNNSCPLSCDETITTHLVGEYLCTVKCDVRGTEYNFKALKAVVVEATTSPPPSQSGTIAASVLVPTFIIVPIATGIILWMKRRNAQVKKDEESALILLEANDQNKDNVMRRLHFEAARTARMWSAEGAQNRSNRVRSHDEVAEKVIELRYTLHAQLEREAEDEIISGVTLLDGRLFIACKATPTLQVFECRSTNFSPDSKTINVPNLVCAVDICSCKENKCLYIMDKKADRAAKEVLKIDPEGKLIIIWKTKDSAGGYLSTTEQGNVIIAVKYRNMLLEYSHDGNLLRDIKFKEHINPWHAITVANDCYVVSHGAIYDPLHRVCLVDRNGDVKKSFGRNSGSAEDQLNTPNYLTVASNGYVMVANFGNNRVLLLDSELKFKANIVARNKQEFRCPQRIYVDERILVVAINASNPKETTAVEEDRQIDETDKGDHSSVKDALLQKTSTWTMKEYNDPEHRPIEEDCLLLVFDIQQLLMK